MSKVGSASSLREQKQTYLLSAYIEKTDGAEHLHTLYKCDS